MGYTFLVASLIIGSAPSSNDIVVGSPKSPYWAPTRSFDVSGFQMHLRDRHSGDVLSISSTLTSCKFTQKKYINQLTVKKNNMHYWSSGRCRLLSGLDNEDEVFIDRIEYNLTGRGRLILTIPVYHPSCADHISGESNEPNSYLNVALVPSRHSRAESIYEWRPCQTN